MLRTPSIIVVDPDPDDQEMLRDVFQQLGVSEDPVFLGSSREALHYFTTLKEPPALVICDVRLPDGSGLFLRRQLESRMSFTLTTFPFVFLSDFVDAALVQQAYSLGAHGFFQKPNHFQSTLKLLATILAYWQAAKLPPL